MALAIFLFTYIFIAGARLPFVKLDRPGGALLGATLMVVVGVVTPAEVFGHSADRGQQAIDMDTLVLLLGMMLLAAYLAQANFFRAAGAKALRVAHTPRLLLVAVTFVSAVLSAFLVNDTVCLFLTPLVLVVVEDARLPPVPYLLAVCMGSNSGSVATFTGNPQNMLIQGASGLGYARFAGYMALPALISTVIVAVALLYLFRKQLPTARFDTHPPPLDVDRRLLALALGSLLGVVVAFFVGLPMSWSALAGGVLVMSLSGHESREALERVDWVLLLFFASLFVVVHGVNKEGWAEEIRQVFSPLMAGPPWRETLGFAFLTLVASNLFSNVPFVMLARAWVPAMQQPELAWHVLALGSTLAGNLTLVGSVANLIVFEAARGKVRMGFVDYLRVGVPVTLISFVVGLGVLLAEHALFP
ncbi:anion transporter [Corallococcus praedator]|uniref:Anion transporter n=1 Tax=Corallococcus praedator TaxID=2316724 RepID=A0ABX9Q5A2_9BACT|nr:MULTISPECIES: SLC13 family permease [Corallococcus]RKH23452.1 anion transporter [Corallococcus sp. CA031C]RKH92003.1 anion transporter [Corallococcus praedator]